MEIASRERPRRQPEDLGLEWSIEVFVEHRVEARTLLRFIVGVDDCCLDQGFEFGLIRKRSTNDLLSRASI